MNLFDALANFFRKPKLQATSDGFILPLHLSEADVRKLQMLRASEGFDVLLKALDSLVKFHAESLLSTNDSTLVHVKRGTILGIREAGLLIDQLTHQENVLKQEKLKQTNARSSSPTQRQFTSALYGSAAWRNRDDSNS